MAVSLPTFGAGSRSRARARSRSALRRCAAYLDDELVPFLAPLGFDCKVLPNPRGEGPPFLIAERIEKPSNVTILVYGHGDTVRGFDALWRAGLAPWTLTVEGERWYGRGTADNKGQHSINIAAIAAVLAERGRLGFNVKLLIEMGEEFGSARSARAVRTPQGRAAQGRCPDRIRWAAHRA